MKEGAYPSTVFQAVKWMDDPGVIPLVVQVFCCNDITPQAHFAFDGLSQVTYYHH